MINSRYYFRIKAFALQASILYLLVPGIIFLFGWVTNYIAIPLSLGLIYMAFRIFRDMKKESVVLQSPISCSLKDIICLVISMILALFVIEAIAFHGHIEQAPDFIARNPIYIMLTQQGWPIKSASGDFLVYYHTYWLVPALISKVQHFVSPDTVIFIWSYLGLALALLLLFCRFKGRVLLFLLILLSLDNYAQLLNPMDKLLPALIHDEELLDNIMHALRSIGCFSSFCYYHYWTGITFMFNVAIPLLLTAAIFSSRCIPYRYIFCICGIGAIYCPITALLAIPFLLAIFLRNIRLIKSLIFNIPMWICTVYVLLNVLYFKGLTDAVNGPHWNFVWIKDSIWMYSTNEIQLSWVRVVRATLLLAGFCIPLIIMLNHHLYRTKTFIITIALSCFITIVCFGCVINELLTKGSMLLYLSETFLLTSTFAYANKARKCFICLLILPLALHIPSALHARKIYEFSFNPEITERHKNNEMHGTLDHPEHRFYRNFWGKNKAPGVLYNQAGEAMEHFPLRLFSTNK